MILILTQVKKKKGNNMFERDKYCESYEKLKAYLLKKNLDIFRKLSSEDCTVMEIAEAKVMNEIIVMLTDIEWKNFTKPDIWNVEPTKEEIDTFNEEITHYQENRKRIP